MARQCWDEARHVEISVKLGDWMGSDIGEFAEGRGLYQVGCNPDPALRLCAVNRGIEGLAIDVFANMKAFGTDCSDPVMTFCEDWMPASPPPPRRRLATPARLTHHYGVLVR